MGDDLTTIDMDRKVGVTLHLSREGKLDRGIPPYRVAF